MGWQDIPKTTIEKFGMQTMVERARAARCPFCNKEVNMTEFKDHNSVKEFRISGLCQGCQDDFFGK